MCPRGGRLIDGDGGFGATVRMVCHCLLIEGKRGLVLVDAGIGTEDVARAKERLGREFLAFARPRLDRSETAYELVTRLGHSPKDVRDIVVTHLDLDHAGGIADFPWATLHVTKTEHTALQAPSTFLEGRRYRPIAIAKTETIETYEEGEGDRWFGFPSVRVIGDDVLIIPLSGHSRGHAGVAVKTDGGRWLLHAGDAYFHRREMADPPSCPSGLAGFQKLIAFDDRARRTNQDRLRALVREPSNDVRVFSAHDATEFDALSSG